jgi:hypothetical protein
MRPSDDRMPDTSRHLAFSPLRFAWTPVMRIRSLLFRSHAQSPSPVIGVLLRVRQMREQCEWPTTTNPTVRERRRERIRSVRLKVAYPSPSVESSERPIEPVAFLPHGRVAVVVIIVLLLSLNCVLYWPQDEPRATDVSRGFIYRVPDAPPFLSEKLALIKAEEALSQIVPIRLWRPAETPNGSASTAPDGTRDLFLLRPQRTNANEGILTFKSTKHPNTWNPWTVHVSLKGDRVWCTVSKGELGDQ